MNIREISAIIQKAATAGQENYCRQGVVRSVDLTTKTCQVELLTAEFDINNIKSTITCKLSANQTGNFYFIPVIGSDVVISFEAPNVSIISLYSEVENVAWTTAAGATITIDEKIQLFNATTSMKEIFNDLMSLLQGLSFNYLDNGVIGITTQTLGNLNSIANLQTKINALLK